MRHLSEQEVIVNRSNFLLTKLVLMYAGFMLLVLIVIWSGAISTMTMYLDQLAQATNFDSINFIWNSIFFTGYYMTGFNPDAQYVIEIPALFKHYDGSNISIWLNYYDFTIVTVSNDLYFTVEPTVTLLVTTFLILCSIFIFHIIVNYLLRKTIGLTREQGLINAKINHGYLGNKVTGAIAANIHHELKTPLSALNALNIKNRGLSLFILDAASICTDRNLSKAKQQEKLNNIARDYGLTLGADGNLTIEEAKERLHSIFQIASDSLTNMFHTVDMINEVTNPLADEISIYDIIDKSITILRMSKNHQFTTIIDQRLKNCYLDELNPQAFSNIIINHTLNSIEANAKVIKFDVMSNILKIKDIQILKIDIIDDGKGIPFSNVKHAYQLKWTSKDDNQKRGAGLYICKTILNRFGGDEEIKYTDKYGTIFELKVPVKECNKREK